MKYVEAIKAVLEDRDWASLDEVLRAITEEGHRYKAKASSVKASISSLMSQGVIESDECIPAMYRLAKKRRADEDDLS